MCKVNQITTSCAVTTAQMSHAHLSVSPMLRTLAEMLVGTPSTGIDTQTLFFKMLET